MEWEVGDWEWRKRTTEKVVQQYRNWLTSPLYSVYIYIYIYIHIHIHIYSNWVDFVKSGCEKSWAEVQADSFSF